MYSRPSEQRQESGGNTTKCRNCTHLLVQGNTSLPIAVSILNDSVLSEVCEVPKGRKHLCPSLISHLIAVACFCSFNRVA